MIDKDTIINIFNTKNKYIFTYIKKNIEFFKNYHIQFVVINFLIILKS